MTLEAFFEKFELFADAPNAVEKMRDLVLEAAVRGALSERLAGDQDDTTWRVFISNLDQQVSPKSLCQSLPFEIPDRWRWVRLNDLGKTKVRNDVADETRVSFVPMAFIPAGYGLSCRWEEKNWSEVKKGFTHFANGDVVMAKITPCFENAKSAVMRNLVSGVGAGTTELHVFRRGTDVILTDFVLIYLKTPGFITRGETRMTGSAGQKRVPHDYFAASPFPLPPPAEQKRIVAKVNELMALCDQLEAQQQERETRHVALSSAALARFAEAPTPANLNFLFHRSYDIAPADLRKSILSLAVQGKLVTQDPKDESVESSLPKLAAAAVQAQDDLFPSSWLCVPLGATGEWRGGGTPSKSRPDYWEGDMPWVSPKDMKVLIIHDAQDHISTEGIKGSAVQLIPKGSILMVVRGMILARAFPVALTAREVTINQDMKALLPLENEAAEFILLALRAYEPNVLAVIDRSSHGTCKLRMATLESILIPIPPLAEQQRIVARVDQLMALVDQLEAQLTTSRATAMNLLKAIIGELTAPTKG